MTLYFDKETCGIRPEIDHLIATYWQEENKGHVPLRMDWELYKTLEKNQILYIYTARSVRDTLVGVVMYNVVMHPHHMGHRVAECDILSVSLQDRGQGVGRKLLSYAEDKLKTLGVSEIVHRFKLPYTATPLFISQGYNAIETVYSKKVA